MMKKKFSKKEELRILEKFMTALHGESRHLTIPVIHRILEIGEFSCLGDLKRKYKIKMADGNIEKPDEWID